MKAIFETRYIPDAFLRRFFVFFHAAICFGRIFAFGEQYVYLKPESHEEDD
jgi:hypothetical protein